MCALKTCRLFRIIVELPGRGASDMEVNCNNVFIHYLPFHNKALAARGALCFVVRWRVIIQKCCRGFPCRVPISSRGPPQLY